MVHIFTRRSNDLGYFTNDPALELDGIRDGPAGWWLRGGGPTSESDVLGGVLGTTKRSQVVGYDIVFSAPRPTSILLAIDHEKSVEVVRAHRSAVQVTMMHLEDRALCVRDRTNGGDESIPAMWSNIVSFTHGLNRHGEPHLHDHVIVGALAKGEQNVLDSRALFGHVKAANALYLATLRLEIAKRTDLVAWRSFDGQEHIGGLDEGYRSLWGGRHDGRGEKLALSRGETERRWEVDRRRFEPEGVLRLPPREKVRDVHAFGAALEGRYSVARRHLVEAWANASRFGASVEEVERSIDSLYPDLQYDRGMDECFIGVDQARTIARSRERESLSRDHSLELDRAQYGWSPSGRDLSINAANRWSSYEGDSLTH